MSDIHQKRRPVGFRQVTITLSGGSDILFGANSKRCGLSINVSDNGGVLAYSFDGTDPGVNKGVRVTGTTGLLFLGRDFVEDVITGPIKVLGPVTQTLTALEWFYLD